MIANNNEPLEKRVLGFKEIVLLATAVIGINYLVNTSSANAASTGGGPTVIYSPKGPQSQNIVSAGDGSIGVLNDGRAATFTNSGINGFLPDGTLVTRPGYISPQQQITDIGAAVELNKRNQTPPSEAKNNPQPTQNDIYKKRIDELKQQIKQNPNDAKLYIQLVDQQIRNESPSQEIIKVLEYAKSDRVIKNKEESFKIDYELGLKYSQISQWQLSINAYKTAKKTDPDNELAKFIDYNISQVKLKMQGKR